MSEFIVVSGLSGAGRSEAANHLEDLGWFVIDNVPASLIPKVGELAAAPESKSDRVALVVRTSPDVDELRPALDALRQFGRVRILLLTAATPVIVRRYESTRRRHPLATHDEGVAEAIERERAMLAPLQDEADIVVDTSDLNVHQLRARLVDLFGAESPQAGLHTSVVSFGFTHGLPVDVDMVLDCRFLPNPHWIDDLRPLTGLDAPVRDYVLSQDDTRAFIEELARLLQLLLPGYEREGKSYLSIAVGCTGGRHRSVVIAEEIARLLRDQGFAPAVTHRDLTR